MPGFHTIAAGIDIGDRRLHSSIHLQRTLCSDLNAGLRDQASVRLDVYGNQNDLAVLFEACAA
jgi:hypothetical protein